MKLQSGDMRRFAILLVLISICQESCYSYGWLDTGYDRENGHPSIQYDTFSISFMIQGDFNGEFKENIEETKGQIADDMKQKMNTMSIREGTYDIQKVEDGISDLYIEADKVQCDVLENCVPSLDVTECYFMKCDINTLFNNDIGNAAAEHIILDRFLKFFTVEKYDKFQHVEYQGPYSKETSLDIKLYGVKPSPMDAETTEIFESLITNFYDGMSSKNSWIEMRPIAVANQSISQSIEQKEYFSTNTTSLRGNTTSLRGNTEKINVFHVLETSLKIYSVHNSKASNEFEENFDKYLIDYNQDLVHGLKDSGSTYFAELVDGGIIPSSEDLYIPRVKLSFLAHDRSSGTVLIYGMMLMFFVVIWPTICYILYKDVRIEVNKDSNENKNNESTHAVNDNEVTS